MNKKEKGVTQILRIAFLMVLIGRGWQHLFQDVPIRALLWDETLIRPLVEHLWGLTWAEYLSDSIIWIDPLVKATGLIYWVLAVLILIGRRWRIGMKMAIGLSTILLIVLAFLYTKERFWASAQFFEYSLQFMCPLFFGWAIFQGGKFSKQQILIFKLAIALTFICHGLYALNIYPRPALFTAMTLNILPGNEQKAIHMLNIAGFLDLAFSVMLFLKKPYVRIALIYCIFWGFLTALARIVAHFYWDWWWESLLQWTPEMLFRFPHFMIPLALFSIDND